MKAEFILTKQDFDNMDEEGTNMEDKKYIKFDIPEWVNWLARDESGGLYGYNTVPEKFEIIWGVSDDTMGDKSLVFLTEDPNHYPEVKWSDEEPKPFKNGITLSPWVFGSSELDTNEAITALQDFGNTLTDTEVDDLTDEKGEKITIEDALRWGFKTVSQIREGEPDMVNTPPHYKQYSFEPIDIITEVVKEYPPEIGFHIGTVLKYLFRSPFKGKQEEDINKAAYYLARAIKELTDE